MKKTENMNEVGSLLETEIPDVPRGTIDKLLGYVNLCVEWNHHLNMTGAESRQELIEKHLLDCVFAWRSLPENSLWCDVGTGAGLPGLVWAILAPEKNFILVESTQKKAAFLLRAISLLGLLNIRVLTARFESLGPREIPEEKINSLYCVSRGTASPKDLLPLISSSHVLWKKWFAFSSEKTHEEFLTLAPKFGMEVNTVQYPKYPSRLRQIGRLTVLEKKK